MYDLSNVPRIKYTDTTLSRNSELTPLNFSSILSVNDNNYTKCTYKHMFICSSYNDDVDDDEDDNNVDNNNNNKQKERYVQIYLRRLALRLRLRPR